MELQWHTTSTLIQVKLIIHIRAIPCLYAYHNIPLPLQLSYALHSSSVLLLNNCNKKISQFLQEVKHFFLAKAKQ